MPDAIAHRDSTLTQAVFDGNAGSLVIIDNKNKANIYTLNVATYDEGQALTSGDNNTFNHIYLD